MSDENEELSMREEMESAVDKVEEDNPPVEDNYVEETPEVEASEAQEPTDGDTPPSNASEAQDEPGTTDSVKPPVSWSPKLREDFAKLPPHLQQQISKRESEINKFQNDGAEARKMGDKFSQALQPYHSVMAAHGATDPVEAVKGLMDTAATLQMGTPQQKAEKLGAMIQHYGIDINMLDTVLSGQPIADPQTTQLEQMLEQKLAPMQKFMSTVQQSQQHSQQQVQQSAQSEIAAFEQNAEFMNDVREDMADLLDMASRRGVDMSLQQAYDKACALNPEISGVLSKRQADERIMGNQTNTLNKRNAASSIRGNQMGSGGGNSDLSIGSLLNAAWDDQNR